MEEQERRTGSHSGETLASYQLLNMIGSGGMAEVYRARDLSLGREVAVKVLLPELTQDIQFVERFRKEASHVAALEHRHVVPIYHYGEEHGLLFLVMPLLRGGSLRERLRHEKRFDAAEAVHITVQIAAALDAAHTAQLVHRDVKPENILFNLQGEALLTDFGLARDVPPVREGWEQHNTTGVYGIPVGTPEYMAPEQFRRTGVIDERADIYALGAVLYEMLTGRVPFSGTPQDLAARALRGTSWLCQPPSSIVAAVWPALDPRVMTALAMDPEGRYQSARDFAEALRQTVIAYTGQPLPVERGVMVVETSTSVAAPAKDETADLPAIYRLPTPPELMRPETWPLQAVRAVQRSSRLPMLLLVVLLLAITGTSLTIAFSRGGGNNQPPIAASGTPTPTRTPSPTPTPSPTATPTTGTIIIPPPAPTATPTPPGTGLYGHYWKDSTDMPSTGKPSTGTEVAVQIDPVIDFNWTRTTVPPGDIPWSSNYCVRWTGSLVAPVTGTYYLTTDTSSQKSKIRVYIGDGATPIIDTWGGWKQTDTAPQPLIAHKHTSITINYCNGKYSAGQVSLKWQPPGGAMVDIPTSALYPS
jgi:serine/threonine-protein kinase